MAEAAVVLRDNEGNYYLLPKQTVEAVGEAASPAWRAAACRGVDPELFFPERGVSVAEAQAVCRSWLSG